MLKKRLIPKLQLVNHTFGSIEKMVLVTTLQFNDPVIIGDPVSQAKIYEAQAADELIFVLIRNQEKSKNELIKILNKVCSQIFMPITIGGGIKSIEDIKLFLDNGADKVSLNTAIIENPNFINQAVQVFGSSNIVASVDYKMIEKNPIVFSNNGLKNTNINLFDWVKELENRGVGEISLTAIDKDGTRSGMDIEIIKKVNDLISIPLLAGGGCGFNQHFVETFKNTNVSGITAGTYFCFKDENPMQTRGQIFNSGIPIRLQT